MFARLKRSRPHAQQPMVQLAYAGAIAAAAWMSACSPSAAGDAYAATTTAGAAPRYMSLGADLANGREGPSRDHRILWIYQRRGLPVKVVQEWQSWRKVEDPFGDQIWLLASKLQRQRTIYVIGDNGEDAALRNRPKPDSGVVAQVARGVVGELQGCSRGWCEVKLDGMTGWLPRRTLWGADSPVAK
jgi:SH3-like domain-containing protein